MLTSINEERGQVAAQRRGRVVNGEDSVWQPHVPVVLAAIGEGPQRVTQHAIDPLGLGVGVLVVSRADEEARTDALRELLKRRTRELGVDGSWSATSTSEAPSPEPRAISRMICADRSILMPLSPRTID